MSEENQPQAGTGGQRKNLLFSKYKTNLAAEAEGVWCTPSMLRGVKDAPQFKIARIGGEGNKVRTRKVVEEVTRDMRIDMANDTDIDPDVREKIGFERFLGCSLLDWKNVTDENGELVEFSRANARKILDQLPDLTNELIGFSMEKANYNEEKLKADAANL